MVEVFAPEKLANTANRAFERWSVFVCQHTIALGFQFECSFFRFVANLMHSSHFDSYKFSFSKTMLA